MLRRDTQIWPFFPNIWSFWIFLVESTYYCLFFLHRATSSQHNCGKIILLTLILRKISEFKHQKVWKGVWSWDWRKFKKKHATFKYTARFHNIGDMYQIWSGSTNYETQNRHDYASKWMNGPMKGQTAINRKFVFILQLSFLQNQSYKIQFENDKLPLKVNVSIHISGWLST